MDPVLTPPPNRIPFTRGVLTRVRVENAEEFEAAVAANAAHLRDWVPWADDPEGRHLRGGGAEADWLNGVSYLYAVRPADDGPIIGGLGLYRRVGEGGIEIGYWLDVAHTGTGLATEAVGIVTTVALDLPDVTRVEIHNDEANLPSAAIPQRLGYRLVRVDEVEPRTAAETGRLQVWITP
jgi:RimJ/RimL family protein N-acetyltransferase